MIQVSFPDGSVKEYPEGSSPLDVAQGIGSRLAQAAAEGGRIGKFEPPALVGALDHEKCEHARSLTQRDAK